MNICIISPIEERVPPQKYGGISRIVSFLTEELVLKNHQVTLMASGDSQTRARLIPVVPKAGYPNNPKAREAYLQIATAKIIEFLTREHFDVVSNHFGWRLIPFHSITQNLMITTLHTPLDQINKKIIFDTYKNVPVISSSTNQRQFSPDLNYLATIYDGINMSLYDFSDHHDDYLVFLGRISPEKGASEAIQIAKKLNKKLIMAAAIPEWDKNYFEEKVKPYIDNENILFLGEIDDKQKNKLLGGAQALLAPIQWDEPFGLVFVEALACGTPIIALNRGSVSEIVVDGKTGIIANSIDDIYKRFDEIKSVHRIDCRKHAENNFSSGLMADNYEKVFNEYLQRSQGKIKQEI